MLVCGEGDGRIGKRGKKRRDGIGFGWIAGNRKEGGEGKERIVGVERRMEWEEKGMGFGNRNEIGWTSWFRVGIGKNDGMGKEIVALG